MRAASTCGASRRSARSAAFITGWSYWSANLPYLPGLLYFGAANALYIGGPKTEALSTSSTYFLAASLGGPAIAAALNVVGLNVGKWMSNAGALATWIPATLLILFGAYTWMRYGSATPFTAGALLPYGGLKDLIFLSSIAFATLGTTAAWFAATARLPFVAGLDRFLPAAFGRIYPRWHTPHVALLVQAGAAGIFVVLGQAGASVHGAYEALVSMGIIVAFIPFLFMFAAMFRLQREPAGSDVIRVPGGPGVAKVLASLGFAVSLASIALACVPAELETNTLLAVSKVVGGSTLLVAIGVALYFAPRRSAQ